MKHIKAFIVLISILTVGINTYGQDPFPFEGNAVMKNNKSLFFEDANGLTDGTRIIRYSGGSLRIEYNINALNFYAKNNQPVHIRNSDNGIPIKFHPNGSSYFNGGNVGFGITNPLDKVHIRAGASAGFLNAITIENDNSTDNSTSVGLSFIASAGDQKKGLIAFQRTAGNGRGDLVFALNNFNDATNVSISDEVMRITKSGNLGIGISEPEEKLHVVGGASIVKNIGEVTSGSHYSSAKQTFELQNDDGGDIVLSFHRKGYNSAFIKHSGLNGLTLSGNGSFDSNHLFIAKTGNVGIGTTTPTSLLSIAGKIDAQEVEVKVAAGTAPDYVFASDYHLTTLEETATYIKENHHLPEVPSAKEMEAEGVNLGEMNMLLLKKIEELTLHLIEKDAQLESVLKRLDRLENK